METVRNAPCALDFLLRGGVHYRVEDLLAVLYADDAYRLLGVVRRVDRRRTRYAGHILRRCDGGGDLLGVGALRVLYRVIDSRSRIP